MKRSLEIFGAMQQQDVFHRLLPFLVWMGRVNPASFRSDIFAALTGASIVLPQAIAFASIAGLPPQYGLYTAMVTPIIAALFGSSLYLVSGPTTAMSALVFAAISPVFEAETAEFVSAALLLTLLVGIIQLAMGLGGLGRLVNFVSHSVMVGFTAGAALLIALSQIRHAFGIDLPRPEYLVSFFTAFLDQIFLIQPVSAMLAATALAAAVVARRFDSRLPNYLIALIVSGIVGYFLSLNGHRVLTVGLIPSVFPSLTLPTGGFAQIQHLAQSALAIAIVGLLEANTIAKSLAARADDEFDGKQEIIGQGLSNIFGSFFSAYAGSGSFTRSGVNFDSGARTPLAAVFASAFLLAILFLVVPLFAYLPIAGMAGIIILVAIRLIDMGEFWHILRSSKSEAATILITFFATLFAGLEFAVYAGVLVSLASFLGGTMQTSLPINAPNPDAPNHSFTSVDYGQPECPQMVFGRIEGPAYFGSVDTLRRKFRVIEEQRPLQKIFVLKIAGIGRLDFAAAELLIEQAKRRKRMGGKLCIASRYPPLFERLSKFKVVEEIGDSNIYPHRHEAISELVPQLDQSVCATCKSRIFRECPAQMDPGAESSKSNHTLSPETRE